MEGNHPLLVLLKILLVVDYMAPQLQQHRIHMEEELTVHPLPLLQIIYTAMVTLIQFKLRKGPKLVNIHLHPHRQRPLWHHNKITPLLPRHLVSALPLQWPNRTGHNKDNNIK
jgi:hypothetical protein